MCSTQCVQHSVLSVQCTMFISIVALHSFRLKMCSVKYIVKCAVLSVNVLVGVLDVPREKEL